MTESAPYAPAGVIPAALTIFHDDYSIDLPATRRHFRFLAEVPGISAITANGHAAEVHALTFEEQQELLEAAVEEAAGRVRIVSGIYADGSLEAARLARMSARAGASALLVFPPTTLMLGGALRPEMALAHYGAVADAVDLPLILFQYPLGTGLGYPFETFTELVEKIPTIRAVKDWCNDPALHDRHTRYVHARRRPVNMLTTHSSWLMASLTMGARGLLSGAGSVIADMQVAMFEAIQAKDLARAQRINALMLPITGAFYAEPFLDMHNRMKECLVMLGRAPRAVVRPPLMKLATKEIAGLKRALKAARVGEAGTDIPTQETEQ